ncbi:MAG TPA: ATP-binding cassette domain-containing protein, partial [Spirochaetia bacterium]|nr:ATP-binding cassette domain-containing protein [Spirochaetia bacterium]
FAYEQGKPVLDDFNLTFQPGTVTALVGHTGSGKSTVINLLARFYEPTAGEILIHGRDYREYTLPSLQSRTAAVLQTPHLFSGTVRENIRYGNLAATNEEIERAARLVFADPFIRKLKRQYDTEVGENGAHLSTGQKQLVSLARAVLADPDVLIMDEATSAIDTETEELIRRGEEAVFAGRTCVVIAHRLSTVRNADRIVVLDRGRIIESGRHEELLDKQGAYFDLYMSSFEREAEKEIV